LRNRADRGRRGNDRLTRQESGQRSESPLDAPSAPIVGREESFPHRDSDSLRTGTLGRITADADIWQTPRPILTS
jgi:hypothetical protein